MTSHNKRVAILSPVAWRTPPRQYGAWETVAALRREADDVVCVETPGDLRAVGEWYVDFSPTSDDEVLDLLRLAG